MSSSPPSGIRNRSCHAHGTQALLPTERLVNHTQPSNVTEGYAVDWTVEQLRKPAHLMNPDRSANEASSAVAERSLPIA